MIKNYISSFVIIITLLLLFFIYSRPNNELHEANLASWSSGTDFDLRWGSLSEDVLFETSSLPSAGALFPTAGVRGAVFVVLPRSRIDELITNLALWSENFFALYDFQYPLLVFYDDLQSSDLSRITQSIDRRMRLFFLRFRTKYPPQFKPEQVPWPKKFYPMMCRLMTAQLFRHPVWQHVHYFMRLDTDSELLCAVRRDPFAYMKRRNLVYAGVDWRRVGRAFSKGMLDIARGFAKARDIRNHWLPEDLTLIIQTNFELARMDFVHNQTFLDFAAALDAVGGFFLNRWGDHNIRSLQLALMIRREQMELLELPYKHQQLNLRGNCTCKQYEEENYKCVKKLL